MLSLVNAVVKNRIGSSKYQNIKKSRNEIIKILVKSKSWNLLKFKFKNLSKSQKV